MDTEREAFRRQLELRDAAAERQEQVLQVCESPFHLARHRARIAPGHRHSLESPVGRIRTSPDCITRPGESQVEVEAVREERADLQQRLRSAERHLARLRVPEVRAAGFLPRACQ